MNILTAIPEVPKTETVSWPKINYYGIDFVFITKQIDSKESVTLDFSGKNVVVLAPINVENDLILKGRVIVVLKNVTAKVTKVFCHKFLKIGANLSAYDEKNSFYEFMLNAQKTLKLSGEELSKAISSSLFFDISKIEEAGKDFYNDFTSVLNIRKGRDNLMDEVIASIFALATDPQEKLNIIDKMAACAFFGTKNHKQIFMPESKPKPKPQRVTRSTAKKTSIQ